MLTRFISLFLFFLFCQGQLSAQKNFEVKGVVTDAQSVPLIAATVVLLELPDSTFANYGLTTDDGKFRLDAKKNVEYILQVSYMGFGSFFKKITLDKDYDFKTIVLEEWTNTIDGIQVEAEHIPVRMRGDTLEFNSAAFNVEAHDDVEKLLEQMPGVEILEDGTIKINGKKVEKILVDGKEFFGEDAQAALKNLPADAIGKIEVFDKKTDTEELTDSDSETENKTINLTLKEDKKVGFMGNVEAGYGLSNLETKRPSHRYKGSLSLNYFNPKMRLSVIGAANNVNEAGFTYKDYQGMSGGSSNFMAGNQGMSIGGNWDDPIVNLMWGGGEGEVRAISGGINMNLFFTEKTEMSIHYMYTNADRSLTDNAFDRSITTTNFYTRNSTSNNFLLAQRHIFNGKFTTKIDSTQEFRFRFKLKLTNSNDQLDKFGETLGVNDTLENEITQDATTNENALGLITNLHYQKKFKKKGRSILSNIAFAYVDQKNTYDNYSNTNLYNNNGILTQIDTLNQNQRSTSGKQVYGAQVSYVEPIGNDNFLTFKFMAGFSSEDNNRKAFDLFEESETSNDSLTDFYQKYYNFQEFRTQFKREVDKISFRVAAGITRSALEGILSSSSIVLRQEYYYPIGNLRFKYKITKNKSVSISYRSRISEPRLDQLQPMVNNQNPLSLSLGNPNLIPTYNHNVWLGYNLWDQLTFTSVYVNGYFNITQNPIINSRMIDENFRTIYQPINGDLSFSGGAYLGYNGEIKKLIKISLRGGASINQSPVLLNGIASTQLTHNYNVYLSIGNKKKKVFDLSASASVTVGNSIFSNNSSLNVTYVNHSYTAKARVIIAKKWTISTDFNCQFYTNVGYEEAITIPIWSAKVSRTFFKGDQLKIELVAKNLLNEAFQFNRYTWGDSVSERQTNMLGRYFMVVVAYKINKMGGKKSS
jgi:hypothetical protein